MNTHPFEQFLEHFIPKASKLQRQIYKLLWIMETTGSPDAADLKAELDTEYKLLFHDKQDYQNLLEWSKDPSIKDPILKRQLNVLLYEFKKNQIPEDILRHISTKESELSLSYANFRPECDGKFLTENEIREILKKEINPMVRKKIWAASKQIGEHLAPKILEIVRLRNQGAQTLGYDNYFEMQLELQEVDPKWLLQTFETLAERSSKAYEATLGEINTVQSTRFKVAKEELGPWAWSDPFCQEDPIGVMELDNLVQNLDFIEVSRSFFEKMGFEVHEILKRSDMYEKEGKNQHAFCINIDRNKDIRTLNNVKPTLKWLEVVLHELGHAVYELGFDKTLPWLLKEPPHMLATEAMALICGRQAYRVSSLKELLKGKHFQEATLQEAEKGLKRRQLIFSRWVMVMTAFEHELYRNPHQNLNILWWKLVEKFQKIPTPPEREHEFDWAAKYHIGMAPAYYFSYLLGELLASSLQDHLPCQFNTLEAGAYFNERLFRPGNSLSWSHLVEYATGSSLTPDSWLKEFT